MLENISFGYSNVYRASDPLANRPLRLTAREQNWLHSRQVDSLFRGEWQPPEPVLFRTLMGGRPEDFLWTDYPPLLCVSNRVMDLLATNQCTGWSTYPVMVYDRQQNLLPGYSGFAINSSVGELQLNRSTIILKSIFKHSIPREHYKGLYFDENRWNGSDIFRIEDYFIVVSQKVKNIFKNAKISNVRLTSLSNVEMWVEIFKKKNKSAT